MISDRAARMVYFLGAGRSGTTIFSALLGACGSAEWRGELIHLAAFDRDYPRCSCGATFAECSFWKDKGVMGSLGPATAAASRYEKHSRVLPILLGLASFPPEYELTQLELIHRLSSADQWLVDSSKYVGRALGLASCRSIDARFIYLVRDARGVAFSFCKKVQSPRSLVSACMYYFALNLIAQLAAWTNLRGRCLKVRYEDLIDDPEKELARVGQFLGIDLTAVGHKASAGARFCTDHVAGGNRWVSNGQAVLSPDIEWRSGMTWPARVIAYILCLPFQIINGYRI